MKEQSIKVKLGTYGDFLKKMIAFKKLYGPEFKESDHVDEIIGILDLLKFNRDYEFSIPIEEVKNHMAFFKENESNFLSAMITRAKDESQVLKMLDALKDSMLALIEVAKEAGIEDKEYKEFEAICMAFNRRLSSYMN